MCEFEVGTGKRERMAESETVVIFVSVAISFYFDNIFVFSWFV